MSVSKLYTIFTTTLLVGFFVFLSATPALAALEYKTLEAIPLISSQPSGNDFPAYLQGLYNFAFLAIPICALFMISVGGFMYLTSGGNTSQMGTAKEIIFDSIIGIFIAFLAWLFLYVINPDLVNINIGLNQASTTGTGTGTGTTPPTGGATSTHAAALAKLSAAGISVTSSGNCSDQTNASCTSLDGMPDSAIDKLIALKRACNCSITVTGGTEVGHASHGIGLPIFDLSENAPLGAFLAEKKRNAMLGTYGITKICTRAQFQATISQNCGSYTEAQAHFHIAF